MLKHLPPSLYLLITLRLNTNIYRLCSNLGGVCESHTQALAQRMKKHFRCTVERWNISFIFLKLPNKAFSRAVFSTGSSTGTNWRHGAAEISPFAFSGLVNTLWEKTRQCLLTQYQITTCSQLPPKLCFLAWPCARFFQSTAIPLEQPGESKKKFIWSSGKQNSIAIEAHGAINSCQPGLVLNQTFLNKCPLDLPITKASGKKKKNPKKQPHRNKS